MQFGRDRLCITGPAADRTTGTVCSKRICVSKDLGRQLNPIARRPNLNCRSLPYRDRQYEAAAVIRVLSNEVDSAGSPSREGRDSPAPKCCQAAAQCGTSRLISGVKPPPRSDPTLRELADHEVDLPPPQVRGRKTGTTSAPAGPPRPGRRPLGRAPDPPTGSEGAGSPPAHDEPPAPRESNRNLNRHLKTASLVNEMNSTLIVSDSCQKTLFFEVMHSPF